jgi:hypothetical protein
MRDPRLTQGLAERWVREWQEVLRLRDWEVEVAVLRGRDMKAEDCEGLTSYQAKLKRARIELRDPIDHDGGHGFGPEPEETLVHELLHLHFATFYAKDETAEQVAQEQAIELIAHGLVTLKRRAASMATRKAGAATTAPKKAEPKGKAEVPGAGGKPRAMEKPAGGEHKMAGSKAKAKGGKGKGKRC